MPLLVLKFLGGGREFLTLVAEGYLGLAWENGAWFFFASLFDMLPGFLSRGCYQLMPRILSMGKGSGIMVKGNQFGSDKVCSDVSPSDGVDRARRLHGVRKQ